MTMNKKMHWSEIWKKDSDRVWNETHDPNNITAELKMKLAGGIRTEVLAKTILIPNPQPTTISDDEEEDIDQEVINHVSE